MGANRWVLPSESVGRKGGLANSSPIDKKLNSGNSSIWVGVHCRCFEFYAVRCKEHIVTRQNQADDRNLIANWYWDSSQLEVKAEIGTVRRLLMKFDCQDVRTRHKISCSPGGIINTI